MVAGTLFLLFWTLAIDVDTKKLSLPYKRKASGASQAEIGY